MDNKSEPQRLLAFIRSDARRFLRGIRTGGTALRSSANIEGSSSRVQAYSQSPYGDLHKFSTAMLAHRILWESCVTAKLQDSLLLSNINVFPSDLHAATGVDLQADDTISEFRRGISEISNLHAVQVSDDVIAAYRDFEVVPLACVECLLRLSRGHRNPATPTAFI